MSEHIRRIRPGAWLIASIEVALFLCVFELVVWFAGPASVGTAFGALLFGSLIAASSITMAVPFLKATRTPFGYWAVSLMVIGEVCIVLSSSVDIFWRSL